MKKLKYDYLSGSASRGKRFAGIECKGIKHFPIPYTLYLVSLFLICCSPTLMPPIETDVSVATKRWSDASLFQLNEGHKLYINKCGKCHFLHRPDKYSEEKWNKAFPVMGKKAKLDSLQVDLIRKYIFTSMETKSFYRKK